MSKTVSDPGEGEAEQTAARMRALTEELSAAGLDAHLHSTQGVLDITAALHRPGAKDISVIVDEDGYVQISYWSVPDAAPAQVAAVISRVLTVITRRS
jgi:hypothetical protein